VNADQRNVPITTMNWEVYPNRIYNILKKFGRYDQIKEFILTENGAAFEDIVDADKVRDLHRIQFINLFECSPAGKKRRV